MIPGTEPQGREGIPALRYLLDAVYCALLLVASPWLLWAALKKGKYREGFAEKFLGRTPIRSGDAPCLWLHAVSVGEVALLEPLLREFCSRNPRWQCVISTTTTTGHRLARERYPNHQVFYAPLDFSWATSAAMQRIRPNLVVLAELELWPNLISAAGDVGARIALVNGRVSERSFRGYRRIRWLLQPVLRKLSRIAAQSEEYAERFKQLGADAAKVVVTGSLKFDGAQTDRNHASVVRFRQLAGITDTDIVLLAGSTQAPEEELAIDSYLQLAAKHPELRLILVPRHPERFHEVATLLDAKRALWQRRSELDEHPTDPARRILLVDRVGELRWWWASASIGFVGGSLGPRGGQNMIEPAAFGVATCFGPQTHNFREVVRLLLADDAAVVIQDGAELTEFVRNCLSESDYAKGLGRRAREVVMRQLGATQRTVDLLGTLLNEPNREEKQAA
jgi:3-deoxy-D-manno-octulosonic-acid transferase